MGIKKIFSTFALLFVLSALIIPQMEAIEISPSSSSNVSPKISVLMPVYNCEKYLEKSLDSVLNQTFKDIELICVNDGSKDNSA